MDMSLFSDDDLRAFAEGDISKVSTAGLQLLSGTGLPPPKPTGDTSGFGAAFGAGLKDLQGQFALTRGKLGLLDDEEAKSIYAKKKAEAEAAFTPTKGGWTDDFWNKFKETAGGSAAYMAGPLAAGAVAAGAGAAAPALAGAAGIAGLAGAFGIGVGQFTGSNLGRQMEEGTKYEDLGLGKAALSAIPQAALDTLSMKLLPGIGRLLGSVGKEVTEETAKAMAQQSLKAIAADYLKATGRAMGTEGITEAAQQVFERAQAGLSITDEKARAEYVDNFIGGAVLGGAMSPVGHYSDRGNDIAKGEALGRKRVAEEQKVALEAETQSRLTKLADPEYAEGIAKQMAEANAQLEAMNPGKRKKDATLAEKIEHAQAWKEYNAFETSLRPLQEQYEEVAPLLKKRAAETAAADALKAKEEKEALEAQGLAALTGQRDTLQIQLVEAKKAAKTAAAEGNIEGAAKAQETMDALAEQLKGLAPTITKLQDAAPPTVSDPEALLAKMQKQYAAHIDGGRGAKAAELLPEIGRLHTQVQATRQAFPSAEGAVPGNQTAGPNPFAPPAAAATDTTVPPAAPPAAPNQTNDLLRQVFGTDAAAVAEDAQSRDLYSKPTAAARTPDSTTNNTLALKQEQMFGDIEPGGADPRVGKASQLLAQIEQLQNRPNMPPETQRALENYAKALANPAFEGITQQDYDTALKNAGKVATHPDMVGVTNIGAQNALMRLAENINKIAYQGYGQGEERALNRAEVNARIAAVDAKLNAWRPDPEAIAQARAALQAAKTETADGVIRANAVDPATGKVVARNQTAFDRQAVLKRELDNLLRPTALLAERERLRSSGLGVNMTPYDRQQKQLTTVGTGTSTDIAGEATPEQIANARMVRPKGELVKETGVPAAETADGVARANEIDPATGEVVARNQPFKRPAPRPSELGREVIAVNANPDTVQEQSSFLGAVDEDGAQSTVERVAPPGSGVMDRGITRVERGVERGVGMTRALPSDTEVTAAMQELSPADKQTLNLWDNVFGEGSAANRLVRDAEAGLAKAQSAVDVANGELAGLKAALEEALTPIKAVIGDVLPVKRAAESSEAHAAAMEKYAADVKATEDAKFDAAQGEVQGIGQKIVAATKRLERAKGELDAEMKRLQATGELSPEFMQFIGDSNLEAEVEKATAAVADVLNRSTSGNANNVRILADGMGGAAAKATSALQVQSLIQNTIPDVRRLMGPRVATLVETLLRVKAANNIMGTVQRLTSYIQYSEEALATTLPRAREAAVKAAQKQAAAGDKTTTAATIKADIARAEATAKQEAYQALLKKIDDFTATDPKAKAASKAVAGKTSEIEQLQKTSLDRVTKARTDVARAKETRKLVMENEQALRSGKPSPLQASIAANVKNTEAIYNSTEAALRGAWDTRADARAELTEDVMSFENLLADLARTEAALADLWAGHASSTVDMESEAATLIDAAALLAPTVYDTQMIDANRALDKAELVGGARAAAAEEATLMSELDNALKPLRERLKENADLQKNPQSASHRSALLEHQNRIIKQMNATADLYRERLQAARAEKAQMGEASQMAPDPDSKGWALEQLTNLKVRREAVQAQLDSIAAGIDSIRAERAALVAAERQKQTDVMKTARELGAATDDVRNADTRAKLSEMLNDQRVLEERADKEIAAAEGIVNAAIARVKEEGYTDLDAMQEYRTARKVYDEAVAARARVYDHSLQMMRDQIELVKSLPAMERAAPTPQNAFFNSPAPVAEANPAAVATTAQALKEGVVSGPEQTETAAERAAFEERVNTTDDPAALRKELGGYEGDVANIEAEIEGLAAKTDMQHPMIKLLRKNLAEAEALLEKMYKPSFFDRSLPKADLEKALTNVQERVKLERTRLENGIKGLREKSNTLKQRSHMSPEAAAQLRADIQRRMADGQRKLDAAEKARDAVDGLIPTRITKAIANAQEEIAAAKEDWQRLDMVRGKDTNIRMGLLEKKAALEEKITTITERLSRVERGQSVATIAATQGPAVRRGVATKTALNAGDMISGDITAVAGRRQADGSVGEATTVTKESKVGTRNKVTEKLIHPKVTAEQAVAQANDDMRESNALRSEMVWAKLARDLEAAVKERAEAKLSNDAVQKSKAGAPAKAAAAQRLKDAIAAVKAADAALKEDTRLPAASTAVQRLEKDSREDIAGPPVVYRTSTTTGTGMKAAEVSRLANRVTEGWTNTPNTVVVDTESQLPQRLQDQAARDGMTGKIPGLFDPDSKTVYLVASNLHNGRDVALTIVHEVAGHYGLRDMMGDAYTDTMNRLYEGNASVAQAADKLMAADPRLSKEIAVEETLADMSETTPGKEGVAAALSRVFYAVKQWLWKKLGLKGVTDGEVRQIVANARRHVKRGEARGDSAGGEAVYRTAAPVAHVYQWEDLSAKEQELFKAGNEDMRSRIESGKRPVLTSTTYAALKDGTYRGRISAPSQINRTATAADTPGAVEAQARRIEKNTGVELNRAHPLNGLSFAEAARWGATQTNSPLTRALFERLAEVLGTTKADSGSRRVYVTDSGAHDVGGRQAKGHYDPARDTILVPSAKGSSAYLPTLLHELMHAATHRGIETNAMLSAHIDGLRAQVSNWLNTAEGKAYLRKNNMSLTARSAYEVEAYDREKSGGTTRIYGLVNNHEFLAELFGDRAFQKLLDQIPSNVPRESILTRFVKSIAGFFKFNKPEQVTLLHEAMRAAEAVTDYTKGLRDFTAEGGKAETYDMSPRLSPASAKPDYGRLAGTPITKVGNVAPPDPRTTMQRVLDSISEAWNTGVVDMHAPVKNAMELAKGAGVDGKLVEQALHSLVRTGYSSSLVSQFMTNGGPETVRDSKGLISQRAGGAPSAMEVLAAAEGIPGGNSAAKFELATSYRLAKRGLRVGANKISFNTTPAQLTAVLQQVNADPELKAALNNFNNLYDKYNEALVTWAMESGAITPDLASEMLRHKDYVPMYRNNGGILQIAFGDSQWHRLGDIANTPFMHKLKGGDEAIMPINESIMYNTKLLTDMALVNMAKRNIAYVLQAAGKGKAANGKNKMSVIAGIPPAGRQYLKWKQTPLGSSDRGDRFLEIDTENTALAGIPTDMLAQSIEGHHATMPAYLKWSSYLNDLLRAGVTRVPAYTLRQLIKDPSSIASTSGLEANPLTAVARAFKEYGKGMANRNADIDDMNRRALVQSNILTGDFDDFIKLTHMLADGANPSKTRQFLNLLDKSAHMADAATRVQVYNDSIKRGLSEVEAERRVMESMNFHKRGAWATIQHANRLLPFFNAGIQAINVSIKALQGKMPFEEELKVRQTYLNNMMMLAIGGVAYATMMGDNDEYAKLKPSDKFGFLHIPLPGTDTLLKLPYTYAEGGGMAIAMGQALVEGFKDNAEAKQLLKALFMYGVHALPNQGNLPIPQGMKQAIGVSLNSNMDTWKPIPIVSRSLSSLTPEKQFDANTPEAFKLIGEATGTSPKELAWFADQVTGNIASAVMGTLDMVNPMLGGVAKVEKRLDQVPFIKSLFQNPTTSAASEMAFARAAEATVAHQTLGNMRNRGASAEEIKDFIDSHIKDLRAQPLAGKFVQKLGAINTAMERLRNADMPAAEKTQRIRELEKVRNEIAETVEQAFKEIDASAA